MSIKTELELRLTVDISKPLVTGEREALLAAFACVKVLRLTQRRTCEDVEGFERMVDALPQSPPARPALPPGAVRQPALPPGVDGIGRDLLQAKQDAAHAALTQTHGNVRLAAATLGCSREALNVWLRTWGWDISRYRAARWAAVVAPAVIEGGQG